jgi:hypothetical protein
MSAKGSTIAGGAGMPPTAASPLLAKGAGTAARGELELVADDAFCGDCLRDCRGAVEHRGPCILLFDCLRGWLGALERRGPSILSSALRVYGSPATLVALLALTAYHIVYSVAELTVIKPRSAYDADGDNDSHFYVECFNQASFVTMCAASVASWVSCRRMRSAFTEAVAKECSAARFQHSYVQQELRISAVAAPTIACVPILCGISFGVFCALGALLMAALPTVYVITQLLPLNSWASPKVASRETQMYAWQQFAYLVCVAYNAACLGPYLLCVWSAWLRLRLHQLTSFPVWDDAQGRVLNRPILSGEGASKDFFGAVHLVERVSSAYTPLILATGLSYVLALVGFVVRLFITKDSGVVFLAVSVLLYLVVALGPLFVVNLWPGQFERQLIRIPPAAWAEAHADWVASPVPAPDVAALVIEGATPLDIPPHPVPPYSAGSTRTGAGAGAGAGPTNPSKAYTAWYKDVAHLGQLSFFSQPITPLLVKRVGAGYLATTLSPYVVKMVKAA